MRPLAPDGCTLARTLSHPTIAHAGAHAQVVTHQGQRRRRQPEHARMAMQPSTLQFICSLTPKPTPPGLPPLKKKCLPATHTHKVGEWTDRDIFGKCSHQRASCSAALNESVCPYPSLALSLCRGSRAGGIQSINPEPTAARFRTLKAQPAPLGSRAPSTRGAHKPDHREGGICGPRMSGSSLSQSPLRVSGQQPVAAAAGGEGTNGRTAQPAREAQPFGCGAGDGPL